MALNFPDPATQTPINTWSPTSTPSATTNGTTYTWDGEKWRVSGAPAFVAISGDTMTGNLTVPSLNSGPLAGFRNAIINPNFTIQQRGNSFSAPADEYTFDRWWMGNAAGRNVGITSDGPYQNALLITNNASDNVFLRQGIEIQQGKCGPFVQNSVWTLSLWSDSNAWVGRNLGACAFRDAGKMNNSVGEVALGSVGTFTATGETAAGMSRYSLQIDIGSAQPAATHGMLCVGLSLPSGGHRISGVQLEPGPVATPFEHRPIGLELQLCQRYYEESANIIFLQKTGVTGTTNSLSTNVYLKATKRTTPTISIVGGANVSGISALTFPSGAASSFVIAGTATDASAAARCNGYIADAEL